jgi:hypothetical protein
VNFTVAANPDGNQRTGTLTIQGQIFTVTQQGVGCSPVVSPTTQSVSAAAGPGAPIGVTVAAGCTWTAGSNATWITGVTPGSGTGSGNVNFAVAANTGPGRSGNLTVATQVVTVNQCGFTLTPPSPQMVLTTAADYTVTVAASDANCARPAASVTSVSPWLTIVSGGQSGTGGVVLTFRVTANLLPVQRTATMSIAGQTYTVTQAAGP